ERIDRILGRPSAARANADCRELDTDRSSADHIAAADAGQVAVRRLPSVFDQRRLRAARRARPTPARAATRFPGVVARRSVWLSATGADPDRDHLRENRATRGN